VAPVARGLDSNAYSMPFYPYYPPMTNVIEQRRDQIRARTSSLKR
jgi:hypothetical protein